PDAGTPAKIQKLPSLSSHPTFVVLPDGVFAGAGVPKVPGTAAGAWLAAREVFDPFIQVHWRLVVSNFHRSFMRFSFVGCVTNPLPPNNQIPPSLPAKSEPPNLPPGIFPRADSPLVPYTPV